MEDKLRVQLFEFASGTSKLRNCDIPHKGHHATSLLLRKTSEKDQDREIWTLTWLDPYGVWIAMGDVSKTCQECMQEFKENVTKLFHSLTEGDRTFPCQVKLTFVSLPTEIGSVAKRAVSERGIQGMFESEFNSSRLEYDLYRDIKWCDGLLNWILHWMIRTKVFDLMMISLAIGKFSPGGARMQFHSWVQTTMQTYIQTEDLPSRASRIFWPKARREAALYKRPDGFWMRKIKDYISAKDAEDEEMRRLGMYKFPFASKV